MKLDSLKELLARSKSGTWSEGAFEIALRAAAPALIECAEALQTILDHPRADFPSDLEKAACAALAKLERA